MYSLFNLVPPSSVGVQRYPEWNYVRDGLRRNLATVVKYYRKNPIAVKSSHFLVRLLQSITVPQSQPIDRYYDNVDALSLNLSMALKMTSAIYDGRIFDGVFYGEGSSEVIIAHNDSFDIYDAEKHWENLQPIKVLRHPFSDLGLSIPDGRRNGVETGLSVIAINIPMLALQYRMFRLNEMRMNPMDSQRSIYHFVHMYALTNMLFSHLDVAVFNRINNLQTGAPMGDVVRKHSFYITDYGSKLNQVQSKILKALDRMSHDFVSTLMTVPLVVKDSLAQAVEMPDVVPTRQVVWALLVARTPVLGFLFRTAKDGANTRNQQQMSQIRRSITQYRTERLFARHLAADPNWPDVQEEIKVIAGGA